MARILALPADAISQISSSKHITSLLGVVLSLLENSLDAGATKVEISLHFRRGGCIIEDNGIGIPGAEFREEGGLGKMYHTSKHGVSAWDQTLHGTSGTYLASLAALSFMSITSRKADADESATLVIHQGKTIARQIPSAPGQDLEPSMTHGTRVVVRDLFGNMPVRVKQRALTLESPAEQEKVWQEFKRGVAALMLAWHKPCSVRLHDTESGRKSLHLSAQHPSINNVLTAKSLNNLTRSTTRFDLKDTLPILTQAGLAPIESRASWIHVSASTSKLSVKGAINLQPSPTKQCQFISVGVHPCSADASLNELYDGVNKIFANSSFGSIEDSGRHDVDEAEKDRREHDRRFKSDGYTQKQLRGRKGVDRWPMFVLQAKFNDDKRRKINAENINEGSLKAILDMLEVVATQWLESQRFRPRKLRRRKNEEQRGPASMSSPVKAASTGDETMDNVRDERASTPGLKRPATIGSALPSKKLKVLDITGKTQRLDVRPASMSARDTYFNAWSRIKSGRQDFYEEVWDGKRPLTGSTENSAIAKPAPEAEKMAFRLSSLEVGALDKIHRLPDTEMALLCSSKPAEDVIPNARNGLPGSSDDFGSVDEEAFVEAVQSADATNAHRNNSDENANAIADKTVEWTDPVTKRVFHVNARTGVVLPGHPKSLLTMANDERANGDLSRNGAAIDTSLTSAGRPLSLARRPRTAAKDDGTTWLPGFLRDWNNPVFARQNEEPIPMTSIDWPGMDVTELFDKRCARHDYSNVFSDVGVSGKMKLSKTMLRQAKVVKQVDRKFILCKTGYGGETLVLVDQHAASERVILEQLLAELCTPSEPAKDGKSGVKIMRLDKPLRFEVSAVEHELFRTHAPRFLEWGIVYTVFTHEETPSASHVRASKQEDIILVKSLPPAIAERCVQFPHLLIDLLRTEIWEPSSKMSTTTAVPETTDDATPLWLHRVSSCPKGILDMLNSRACRSAIMFNDILSVKECEYLLGQLAGCVFPFVCAHGRVGMVPVVDLSGEGRIFGSSSTDADEGEEFARWSGRMLAQ